ncbi:MAG: peptidase S24, partial [Parasphingorhabdus sp.]|nr:peptidase S24 [Parasphingorhabdus sp.]
MESDNPRTALAQLIANSGDTYAAISLMLGKNSAYIQQYLKRGTPRKLDEADRRILAEYFGVAEALLGGRDSSTQEKSSATLIEVKQFLIGASAGPGAIAGGKNCQRSDWLCPAMATADGCRSGALSLITVLRRF